MNKDQFLQRLARRQAGAHLAAEPPPPDLQAPPPDLVPQFVRQSRAVGCEVVQGSAAGLAEHLRETIGDDPVGVALDEAHAALGEGLRQVAGAQPFELGWGLVQADAAMARTGSVCFVRTAQQPLILSLAPPGLAVVVDPARLVWELSDFLGELGGGGSVAIVSGPSRSADIENDLTIGVHGPGRVLICLLEG